MCRILDLQETAWKPFLADTTLIIRIFDTENILPPHSHPYAGDMQSYACSVGTFISTYKLTVSEN